MRIALSIALACALLSACGQRGPLFLPGEQRQNVPAKPMASPIPASAPAASTPAPVPDDAATAASAEERENNARRRN